MVWTLRRSMRMLFQKWCSPRIPLQIDGIRTSPIWCKIQPMSVYTLQWPYTNIIMGIFHVFPRYKKINKIKFIEIIEKKNRLSKIVIINFLKLKKSNQNHKTFEFCPHFLSHLQNSWIWTLSYNVLILYVWNFGILDESCLEIKDPLNEWNVILIYYVMYFLKS